ncbi:MAG: hypothetical protein V9G19_21685 [Tetrasphaera sp.]
MDEDFAAYLHKVRAHRGELGDAMRALDDALGLPAGLGTLWRRRVRAALTELAHDLRVHVELTESEGGLHADVRSRSPRLISKLEALQADHVYFLDEVDRLLAARDDGAAAVDTNAHREAVGALLRRLVRHRQRGSDLVYEAYVVDIGGSD